MKSPNILLIMADQLSPNFTGTYGHRLVKTPHMDAIAQRGVRFDAAYCNSPLCAPSRFSMMSGQLISRIAAYDNASEFPASIPTFAHYLRLMGYKTCLSGKMHFIGPDQLHGFEERITTDIYPSDYAWTPNWEQADERIDKWYHNMDSVTEAGVATTTFQIDYDDEVCFFAKRKLMDYARSDAQPFLMVASFIHPHDPYVSLQQWWDLYQHSSVDLPAVNSTDVEHDAFSQRLLEGMQALDPGITTEVIRNARHAYYANISYVDHKIGEIIETLRQTNQLDNTYVIVTADHGDMLGERGLWYKMNFFENSVRVPLLIAGPETRQHHETTVVSLVDLLPTLIDIAGLSGNAKPDLAMPIDGTSLLPTVLSHKPGRDEALGEYCAEMTQSPVFMIRRGQYKFIACDTDEPLLFDMHRDPQELNNLATLSEYKSLLDQFLEEAKNRWDSRQLQLDVINTQKQRRAVYAALETGLVFPWDYNPRRDASQEYVRNNRDWIEAAAMQRYPRTGFEN